jgi:hypothetical protein
MTADHVAIESHGRVEVRHGQSNVIDVGQSGQSFAHRPFPLFRGTPVSTKLTRCQRGTSIRAVNTDTGGTRDTKRNRFLDRAYQRHRQFMLAETSVRRRFIGSSQASNALDALGR